MVTNLNINCGVEATAAVAPPPATLEGIDYFIIFLKKVSDYFVFHNKHS
jgi:hypothetical protein